MSNVTHGPVVTITGQRDLVHLSQALKAILKLVVYILGSKGSGTLTSGM